MTLAEIQTRVRERLDEDAATSLRYTDADTEEYALDGARWYVAKTGCRSTTTTLTQDANTLLSDLPCDLIQVERVLWNSQTKIPLEPTLARTLDGEWPSWQHQADTRARCYFLLGLDRMALWPESTVGGEDYTLHYQQDVFDSVAAVPVEDHECLVSYVIARCLLAEGNATDGVEEYAKYAGVVAAAKRRMASVDRTWSMGRL